MSTAIYCDYPNWLNSFSFFLFTLVQVLLSPFETTQF